MEDARFDRVPSASALVSIVLRAYCLALVKACDLVHARVSTEYYYEVSHLDRLCFLLLIYLSNRKRIL